MAASSISAEHSKEVLALMRELHELRNEIGGHAFNEKKAMPSEMAFTTHGSSELTSSPCQGVWTGPCHHLEYP